MPGDGKVFWADRLPANVVLGLPVVVEALERVGPHVPALLPVGTVIVAVITWDNEHRYL
jgi:hypothetical protein